MRAAIYAGSGGTEVIQFRDVPTPEPGPAQVRVRVRAAGLNRADILQRKGRYPVPPGWPADIPGLEYAGEVEALGPGAARWKAGDRLMGLVGGGAHAEAVVVHEREALAIPPQLSFTEAAAIPEAFLTAYDALVTRGRLQAGERVLVHAVGSGVGTAATQIAKHLGATVLGTSRTASKLERAKEYGLDVGILTSRESGAGRREPNEPDSRLLTPDSVHVILDVLGATAFAANLAALAPRGRLVMLGFLAGSKVEVDLAPILRKRLEVIGSVMRTRSLEERIALVADFNRSVLPLFNEPRSDAQGTTGAPVSGPTYTTQPIPSEVVPSTGTPAVPSLRPVVGATFPMTDLSRAHEAMEGDGTFGKVVLVW